MSAFPGWSNPLNCLWNVFHPKEQKVLPQLSPSSATVVCFSCIWTSKGQSALPARNMVSILSSSQDSVAVSQTPSLKVHAWQIHVNVWQNHYNIVKELTTNENN